ncbi:MAG: AAA family ATPase [Kofleriaceae bacterium]|nr:AAA family ATPase [Kofleriaceae bacterium]
MAHSVEHQAGDFDSVVVHGETFDLVSRTRAGHRVLLKIPVDEDGAGRFQRQLQHELELARPLNDTAVLRPLQLDRVDGRPCLVFENVAVKTLADAYPGGMEPSSFLACAIAICEALGHLHAHSIIHKNLTPQTVLIDSQGIVRLSDLRFATLVPRDQELAPVPEPVERMLPYVSPEQTGRMGRMLDSRSDLYSLGITFYWMLTGGLPFSAQDALAWMHCHLARVPAPPSRVRPTVPEALSDIVLKLLKKNPEERYQSVNALRADLVEAQRLFAATREIAAFPLARTDVPERFRIPQTLFGRDAELATLLSTLRAAKTSERKQLVLVRGPAGMGKSSLVRELQAAVAAERGFFLVGKFGPQDRDVPYATLGAALRAWIDWLLGEKPVVIETWRRELRAALGLSAGLVAELVPELAQVLGPLPVVPSLPTQDDQLRMHGLLFRCVQLLATAEHPVVMFLDDVQWADPASLAFFEYVFAQPQPLPMLVVFAYRDNDLEVEPHHPLHTWLASVSELALDITDIVLGPLSVESTAAMISAITFRGGREVEKLAELVVHKTGGNPFFVAQFLSEIHREGLLAFDRPHQEWAWELEQIALWPVSDNVVDLFVANLSRLPASTLQVLQAFAALGVSMTDATLQAATNLPAEEVERALAPAILEGMVARARDGYVFLHDRIHQAAYQTIAPDERLPLHLEVGRRLAARIDGDNADARVFEVTAQINRAQSLVIDPAERARFAALDLLAARRAKRTAAHALAISYLDAACVFLDAEAAHVDPTTLERVRLLHSECRYLLGDQAGALASLSSQLQVPAGDVHRSAVFRLRMIVYTTTGELGLAVDDAIRCLALLGVHMPARPTDAEVAAAHRTVRALVGRKPIADLVDLPAMESPTMASAIDVMADLIAPAYLTDERLLDLVACTMAKLSLEYGNARGSTLGYTVYGMILGPRFGEYEEGREFGQLGIALVERLGAFEYEPRVLNFYGNYIDFWTRPLHRGLEFSRAGLAAAIASDDITYACYHSFQLVAFHFAAGDPLEQVEQDCRERLAFVHAAKFPYMERSLTAFLRFIASMRGNTPKLGELGDADWDREGFEATLEGTSRGQERAFYQIVKLGAQCFARDFTGAVATAAACEPEMWASRPHVLYPVFVFLQGFAIAQVLRTSKEAQPALRDKLARRLGQLTRWAELCPTNFRSKHALLSAEVARLGGGREDVLATYELAIRSAREEGSRHYQALAQEQAASLAAELGLEEIARHFLQDAVRTYAAWGAAGKVVALRGHPRVPSLSPAHDTVVDAKSLDLMAVLKTSQALSEELEVAPLLRRLLDAIVESTGATRCLLIDSRGDELAVCAEATTASGAISVRVVNPARRLDGHELPVQLVRAVWRSGEAVVLDEGDFARFATDPYLTSGTAKSVLCIPLTRSGQPTGLLYLENELAYGVFTPQRIVSSEILLAQAAISIENARLYSVLRDSQAKLKRLYDSNIIGVVFCGIDGSIQDANDYYLDMIGCTRVELENGTVRWDEITPPEYRAVDEQAIASLIITGTVAPYEKEYVRKDGRRVPVLVTAASLRDGTRHIAAFVLDITERKHGERALSFLAEASRKLASSLDHASTLARIVELAVPRVADWCLIAVQHAGAPLRLLCSTHDAKKATLAHALEQLPFSHDADEGLARAMRTGEAVLYSRVRSTQLEAMGGARHAELVRGLGMESAMAVPFAVRDEQLGGILLVSSDPHRLFTAADLAEAEELGRRCAVAIDNAYLYQEALRAVQMREDFLSITSHELRAPLSPLRMQLDLAREILHTDPDKALQMLERADKQVDSLVRLVDDLLDVSRITVGKLQMQLEPVDLANLVEDVLKRFAPELARAKCRVVSRLERGVVGSWDHGRIEQVVVNLLSNAMKFGAGKPIEVDVCRLDGGAGLRVRDHGVGIAHEDRERIFERFERATPVRHFGGLGLGLYIVRELVAAHRGTIELESEVGKGSCFTVKLPCR